MWTKFVLFFVLINFVFAYDTDATADDDDGDDDPELLNLFLTTDNQKNELVNLVKKHSLDLWYLTRELPGKAVLQLNPRERQLFFTEYTFPIKKASLISLGSMIEREREELKNRRVFTIDDDPTDLDLEDFHNYDEIMDYLEVVSEKHKDIATLGEIGASFEGRDLKYLKIGKPGKNKKAVFINGCIHAREWISCASMVYIIDRLINNPSEYDDYLTNLDIYILPVMNPDGYAYSWEGKKLKSRLWRKTRSPIPNHRCVGIDLNRNFEYLWQSTSLNPCANGFEGFNPSSELETIALKEFLAANKDQIKAYFDIHAFGQFIIHPFSGTQDLLDDIDEYREMTSKMIEKMGEIDGRKFTAGTALETVGYTAPGSAIDYAKGELGIKWAFAFELRGESMQNEGFVILRKYILKGAAECWAAIEVVLNEVIQS